MRPFVTGAHLKILAAIGPLGRCCCDRVALILRTAHKNRDPHRHQLPQLGRDQVRVGGSPFILLVNLAAAILVKAIFGHHLQHVLGDGHALGIGLIEKVVAHQLVVLHPPYVASRLVAQAEQPALAQTGGGAIEHVDERAAIALRCQGCAGVKAGVATGHVAHAGVSFSRTTRPGDGRARAGRHFHQQALARIGVAGPHHHIASLEAGIAALHREDAAGTGAVARADKHIGRRAGQHTQLIAVDDLHRQQRKRVLGRVAARALVGLYSATQVDGIHARKAEAGRADVALNRKQRQGSCRLRLADGSGGAAPPLGGGKQLVDGQQSQQADGQPDHDLDDRKTLHAPMRRRPSWCVNFHGNGPPWVVFSSARMPVFRRCVWPHR